MNHNFDLAHLRRRSARLLAGSLVAALATTLVPAGPARAVPVAPELVQWGSEAASPPTELTDHPERVVALDSTYDFTDALLSDGTVRAWGPPNDYEVGELDVPVDLTDGSRNVHQVSAGCFHSVALLGDGTVRAWGYNVFGQAAVPQNLTDGSAAATQVSAGCYHSVAVLADGTVEAWGYNSDGQASVPAELTDGSTRVVAVDAGWLHNLALLDDGTVVTWGRNHSGESTVPADLVPAGRHVDTVVAGFSSNGVVFDDGTVQTWGQPGTTAPTDLTDGGRRVVSLDLESATGAALFDDGTVRTWGHAGSTPPADLTDGSRQVRLVEAGSGVFNAVVEAVAPVAELNAALAGRPEAGQTLTVSVPGLPQGYAVTQVRWRGSESGLLRESDSTLLLRRHLVGQTITAKVTVTAPDASTRDYVTEASAPVLMPELRVSMDRRTVRPGQRVVVDIDGLVPNLGLRWKARIDHRKNTAKEGLVPAVGSVHGLRLRVPSNLSSGRHAVVVREFSCSPSGSCWSGRKTQVTFRVVR